MNDLGFAIVDSISPVLNEYLALVNAALKVKQDNVLNIFKMSIKDMNTTAIAEFELELFKYVKREDKKSTISRAEENFARGGLESFEQLKDNPRKAFDQFVLRHAEKAAAVAIKHFREGNNFKDIAMKPLPLEEPLLFSPDDFKNGSSRVFYTQSKAAANWKLAEGRLKLQGKLAIKKSKKTSDSLDSISDNFKSILKLAKLFAERTGRSILDATEVESETLVPELFKEIEQRDLQKEKNLRERIAAELLQEEEKTKIKAEQKKKPQEKKDNKKSPPNEASTQISTSSPSIELPKEKEPVLKSIEEERFSISSALNSKRKPLYNLHPRIRRWNVSDFAQIKTFSDTDNDGKIVKHYEHLTQEDLLAQQAYHNLSGIERLLSIPELSEKYSYQYVFKSKDEEKIGKCLYADMFYLGKKIPGTIHVSIGNDKVIFHAMFTPLKAGQELDLNNIFVASEYSEVKEEASWKNVSPCKFEMLDNETLSLKVQRQDVTFILHPLI